MYLPEKRPELFLIIEHIRFLSRGKPSLNLNNSQVRLAALSGSIVRVDGHHILRTQRDACPRSLRIGQTNLAGTTALGRPCGEDVVEVEPDVDVGPVPRGRKIL